MPVRSGDKKAPDEREAVTKVVNTFFERLGAADKVDTLPDLFITPEASITGVSRGAGPDVVWTKSAATVARVQKRDLQNGGRDIPHTVGEVKVDLLDKALAVARVTFRNEFVKSRGAFTFTSEGGAWKIASFVHETRFPDQE